MKELYLRTCLLVYTWLLSVVTWAQDDDEYIDLPRRQSDMDMDMDPDAIDYSPIYLSIGEIFTVAVLLLITYVLSKIWKGCSYMFIAVIVLFYIVYKYY